MFPVDAFGRISFIAEEDGTARLVGCPASVRGRDLSNDIRQRALVIMGKPAAASKPPANLYEMKKRLMQISGQGVGGSSTGQDRQQRASLDRLPEMRKALAATGGVGVLASLPSSSSSSSSSVSTPTGKDRARGKSLSPTPLTGLQSGATVEFRRKERPTPLKPMSLPLEDKRGQDPGPPAPPKAGTTEGQIPPPKPRQVFKPAAQSGPKSEGAVVLLGGLTDGEASPAKINRVVPLTKSYRYRFLPGNNGRVILQAFRRRPWWHAITAEKSVDPASETEMVEYDFLWEMYRSAKRYKGDSFKECCLNHIQYNHSLVTKKGLYFTLRNYCATKSLDVLQIVPRTFYLHAAGRDDSHIGEGKADDIEIFLEYNREMGIKNRNDSSATVAASATENEDTKATSPSTACSDSGAESPSVDDLGVVWICKPASLTNRGFGITVLRGVDEVLALTKRAQSSSSTGLEQARAEGAKPSPGALGKAARRRGAQEGWIVQEYLERPLLVAGRKFDIRCFVLLVMQKEGKNKEGKLKAYFYEDAYVRTSCKKYSMNQLDDRECHLTNDAVQKNAKGYGKFESGNKLTMEEWQTTLERDYPGSPRNVVFDKILPEIKRLSALSVAAAVSAAKLSKTDVSRSFELLGCKCSQSVSQCYTHSQRLVHKTCSHLHSPIHHRRLHG